MITAPPIGWAEAESCSILQFFHFLDNLLLAHISHLQPPLAIAAFSFQSFVGIAQELLEFGFASLRNNSILLAVSGKH
jgi:hypothetical protein